MLSHRTSFLLAASALAGVALVVQTTACSDDEGSSIIEDNDASARPPDPPDAQPGPDAAAPMSTMRLAHLAEDLGPVDFCYQAARTGSSIGPVFRGPSAPANDAGDAEVEAGVDATAPLDAGDDAEAGAARVLTYRGVSKYLTLAATGTLTISVVPAGATSCASPLATGDVTLDPGKLATVVLFGGHDGDGGGAASLVAFTDDRTTKDDEARVRVVHGALGSPSRAAAGPLAVRIVAAQTTGIAERVDPRSVSSPSQGIPVDALGYATIPPVPAPNAIAIGSAAVDGGADAGVAPWQSADTDLDLRGGSLHTAFVVQADPIGFEVVWCADTTTTGDGTACTVVR